MWMLLIFLSGKRGIRTPGTFQYFGFQDRRNRPLCHLSIRFSRNRLQRYNNFLTYANKFRKKSFETKFEIRI